MQIAVVSDIHGNKLALETVLGEVQKLGVDRIICLGDVVNPLPESREIVEFLFRDEIPTIRGNHEDYIISCFDSPEGAIATKARFLPVQLVAQSFDRPLVDQLKKLPLHLRVKGPSAGDILFCHASIRSNNKGWKFSIDSSLASELEEESSSVIVGGHWHDPQTISWRDKSLVTAGSVGIPLAGEPKAQYLVLEEREQRWLATHCTVPFDSHAAVHSYVESGWFTKGGPIAWLLLIEIATATRSISDFFKWVVDSRMPFESREELSIAIATYLRGRGLWGVVEPYLDKFQFDV